VCLEYHIFYKPGATFVLIGVPVHALLRAAHDGGHLLLAIGHKELSTNFSRTFNHAVEVELEEDPHNVGFHIYKLRYFSCEQYQNFFNL
jgi:hypothetical protein